MARISRSRFKTACKGSGGVQAVVAKALGVTRQAVGLYLKKNPDLRDFLDDEGEQVMDVAEHNIDKKIVEGDIDASEWALTNRKRGKARGYGFKQEMEIAGAPITYQLIEMSDQEIKDEKAKHKRRIEENKSKQETNANPQSS